MSRLGSGDILGGVAVLVGGDITPLRAAIAEARGLALQAERSIAVRVPLLLMDNGARFASELSRVLRSAQQLALASPIRVPVVFVPGGGGGAMLGGGGMAMLGGGGSINGGTRMAGPGEITAGAPQRLLSGPGGGTGGP